MDSAGRRVRGAGSDCMPARIGGDPICRGVQDSREPGEASAWTQLGSEGTLAGAKKRPDDYTSRCCRLAGSPGLKGPGDQLPGPKVTWEV